MAASSGDDFGKYGEKGKFLPNRQTRDTLVGRRVLSPLRQPLLLTNANYLNTWQPAMVAILVNMAILANMAKMANSRQIAKLTQITSAMVEILAYMAILANMANSRQIGKLMPIT